MNKFAIYGLSVILAAGFAACDGYEEPNPPAQSNPQGAILQANEVSLTSATTSSTYSLEELNNAGESILLATVTAPNLGEYYDYSAKAELTSTGFSRVAELPVSVEAANEEGTLYNVTVTPDALQGVYYQSISKGPKAKEVQVRFTLYTVSNGEGGAQVAQIGTADTYYGPVTLTVLPFPSEMVIEDNYYLIGTACDWTMTKAIKLNHSDKSPYDDPVFSAKFDVTPGWWWKIVPESTFATGNWVDATDSSFGPEENGDESLAGGLFGSVLDGEEYHDSQAGCLQVSGPYLLTINMEDKTFEFNLTIDCLYTPGNSNGWSQTASQCLWPDESYVNYTGVAHLNGDFKFSSQPDWNGLNYGSTGQEGELTTDGGAGNLTADVDAAYWCTVDIAALTYSIVPMTKIGLIGSATPNGWDASTNLTPSADFLTWTGKVTIGEGEFKLRANDAWDIDFGGSTENLVYKGGNIAAPAAGTYNVTVDFSSMPYSITFVK